MIRKYKRTIAILLITFLLFPSNLFSHDVSAEVDGGEESKLIYHETFEEGMGLFTRSGGAQLEHVTDFEFEGNENGKALYVNNRVNDYDAADLTFAGLGLVDGHTYTVTVKGYIDRDEELESSEQIVLSLIDSYQWLSNADMVAGEAFTLTSEFTVDSNVNHTLRIQSNPDGADIPFYIGEVLIVEEEGSDEEPFEPIEIYSTDFEEGREGWAARGDVNTEVVDDGTGNHALLVTGRSADWHGATLDVTDLLETGAQYEVSLSVKRLEAEEDSTIKITALETPEAYVTVGDTTVSDTEWTKMTGSYRLGDDVSAVEFYVESSDPREDYYIDDVKITLVDPGQSGEPDDREPALPFETITFEDGELNGFEARGDHEILTVTDEANHTEDGSYALKIDGRQKEWNGPSLRVEQYIDRGEEYHISAWVKLISPDNAQLQLSTQVGSEDFGASYNNLEGKTISVADGWVQLQGTYRYSSVGDEFVSIYVESSNNSTASFYIDDITFEKIDSAPIEIEDLPPIKEIYEDYFLIGNAVSTSEFEGERLELLNLHHNLVTAENAMKPGYAYNDDGEFDFTAEDSLMQLTLDEGLLMHGHVLIWHQQSREALHTDADGKSLPREEALENLRTHVKTVVEHFGDDVISWDVVNEAFNDNPSNPEEWERALRNSGWLQAIGPEYIEESFKAAKEVIDENGWDINLYYNDYNDDNQNKATAIYHMVKELNENYATENDGELLIDGIGMQGHYNLNTNPENVRLSLERFISLGVEVGVTELDVTAGSNSVQTEQEMNQQAYLYARLFQIYKEHHEHISRVTFWGLNDASSWRAEQSPLLFDRNTQAKPAYYAVIDPDKFIEEYDPIEIEAREGEAVFGTPAIDGELDDVWKQAPILPINRYQGAWQGADGEARVLWDEENLYVFVQVSDSVLDKSSDQVHEQDSVEVFIDENNQKTSFYQDDDGQYRVNFANETSFNPSDAGVGFESATTINGSHYTVEMKIPFKTIAPENNLEIGFDVQINDAQDGSRQSVAIWNDLSGVGYQDTSVFGNLTLMGEAEDSISDLEEVIRELTERLEKLEAMDQHVEGLEQLIAELRAEIEALETDDEKLTLLIADLLARIETLEAKLVEQESGTGDGSEGEGGAEPEEEPTELDHVDDEVSDIDADNNEGTALPATATSLYNYLLIGTVILLVGVGLTLYGFKRKKA
ncbi:endo-1,4-beta-xylanase [Amphibacillus sp. Q70]|uniref:endo-1,4-beta-xylanase n=1 Tax=Amphibacillus sp. Q70 TaxID=3453416 RepID=UPI003F832E1B